MANEEYYLVKKINSATNSLKIYCKDFPSYFKTTETLIPI